MAPGLSLQTGFVIVAGLTSDHQTEIRVANAHGMTLDDEACWTWYGHGLMLCRCLSRSTDDGGDDGGDGGGSQLHAGRAMALTVAEDPSHALLAWCIVCLMVFVAAPCPSQLLSTTGRLPQIWLLLDTSMHIR